MKCDEVQAMQGYYLDLELDAKTSLEIEQHLAGCHTCTRYFDQEQKLEARMMAGLNRGSKTEALWAQIEREVAAASSSSRARPPKQPAQPVGWPAVLDLLGAQLRAGWRASRWGWSGLAAAWVVIVALNLAAREPDQPASAGRKVPSPSEMRLALKQKHLLMAELAFTPEPAPANKPKAAPPSPHSERRLATLNA